MPSRMAQLAARTAVPTLLAMHGETVVHWPGGIESAAVEIKAIVDRTEQIPEVGSLTTQNGKAFPYTWEIQIPNTVQVVNETRPETVSKFVIDGLVWFVDRVVDPGVGGLQRVIVKRTPGSVTKRGGR
jgi:hypothetical protein